MGEGRTGALGAGPAGPRGQAGADLRGGGDTPATARLRHRRSCPGPYAITWTTASSSPSLPHLLPRVNSGAYSSSSDSSFGSGTQRGICRIMPRRLSAVCPRPLPRGTRWHRRGSVKALRSAQVRRARPVCLASCRYPASLPFLRAAVKELKILLQVPEISIPRVFVLFHDRWVLPGWVLGLSTVREQYG